MEFNEELMRDKLYKLLGDLPSKAEIKYNLLEILDMGRYILEVLELELNGEETVPAYFVKPKTDGVYPVVLYNHAHGGAYDLGKKELIQGAGWIYKEPYAEFLTSIGYSAICIDMWGFGERRGISEKEMFKQMISYGKVLLGMMLFDNMRVIDYLELRGDVDLSKLTVIGTSMGGVISQWTAALDTRVKRCVSICSMFDFEELIKTNQLGRHNFYYTVPNFMKEFSTAKVNSLIAPRIHYNFSGKYDTLAPASALERIRNEVSAVYRAKGAEKNFRLTVCNCGHFETSQMRYEIKKLLES